MSTKQKPDYYKILELTVSASSKQIEAAAMKQLRKYNPETYKGGDANARIEEVLEAKETLLDEDKRIEYDRYWLSEYGPTANVKTVDAPNVYETELEDVPAQPKTNKFFKFFEHFQLREKKVDKEFPFHFRVYDWKTDGMIFLVTGILIPLITLFILAFAANMGQQYRGWDAYAPKLQDKSDNDEAPLIFMGINLLSNLVGFVIFWLRDKEVFTKSGFVIFYEYLFVLLITSFLCSLILGTGAIKVPEGKTKSVFNGFDASGKEIRKDVPLTISDMPGFMIGSVWFQIIGEIVVLLLAFSKTKDLWKKTLKTFRENWKTVVMVSLEAGAVLFLVINYMMPSIFEKVDAINLQSNNEATLEGPLGPNSSTVMKVGYLISLFVLTILIAPLTEELTSRLAIFSGTSNRAFALFTASLFFAMLHVESGDVEHILTYFVGGLVLSSVFSMSRGNVVYDTGAHMTANLFSFITICFTAVK